MPPTRYCSGKIRHEGRRSVKSFLCHGSLERGPKLYHPRRCIAWQPHEVPSEMFCRVPGQVRHSAEQVVPRFPTLRRPATTGPVTHLDITRPAPALHLCSVGEVSRKESARRKWRYSTASVPLPVMRLQTQTSGELKSLEQQMETLGQRMTVAELRSGLNLLLGCCSLDRMGFGSEMESIECVSRPDAFPSLAPTRCRGFVSPHWIKSSRKPMAN